MKNESMRSDCPVNYALELFGDRWTLLIVRDLIFHGKHYYGEFLQSQEKISTNILADRLSSLEKQDIIIKHADPNHKSKFIYNLSKKGVGLLPILVEMVLWSHKYHGETSIDRALIKSISQDKEGFITKVSNNLL